jgi:hypothetical protein
MELIKQATYYEDDVHTKQLSVFVEFLNGTTATYTTEKDLIAVQQQLATQAEMIKDM